MSLAPAQVHTIKSTVIVLQEHGNAITARFYKSMLTQSPELKSLQSSESEEQPPGTITNVGRMNLSKLDKERDLFLGNEAAEYHTCGSESFRMDMKKSLRTYGGDGGRIKLELYGTGGLPRG
ncbi:hypothetical protein B0A49_06188 [Cryomyces minteri]|uniref:Uncharacterized protein n=1 Tax=Cryomyces minteri TaxID=331657 RepID=A0A4U0WWH0_9PEZI|nr:hypothetical protein B0A49_08355 [Cryomyces minteri]TKA67691.1 hypothetical protein B0A49_06188 [Cryomyces minteri]